MDNTPNIVSVSDTQIVTDTAYMNIVNAKMLFPHKASTDVPNEQQVPDYKHQCHNVVAALHHSSPTDERIENQIPNVRCSNSSSSTSPSSIFSDTHIPIVCGVPLPEDENISDTLDPQTIQHNRTTMSTSTESMIVDNRDNEAPVVVAFPEQAPIPKVISLEREHIENKQYTLSNSEKRYWIKVVVIAIVMNTLLVLGAVIGGVCGFSGCNFTGNETATLGDNIYGPNSTDAPTPAPSRRLVASEPPVLVAVNAPTAPHNDMKDESLSYPSFSPVFTSPQPSTASTANGDAAVPTVTDGIKLHVILPIAIIVDVMLIVGYLFFHYSLWMRRRK